MKLFNRFADWLYEVIGLYHSEGSEFLIGVTTIFLATIVIRDDLGSFYIFYGILGLMLGAIQLLSLWLNIVAFRKASSIGLFLYWVSLETMLLISNWSVFERTIAPMYVIGSALNYLKLSSTRKGLDDNFTIIPYN